MTHTRLTTQERRTYRRQLRELVARLSSGAAQLEAEALRPVPGADRPEDEMPSHEADRAVREAEEDVARTLLVSEERMLAEATAALERIVAGTFGTCERCGRVIAKARLNVVPYVRTCIRCAGEKGTDTGSSVDE